MKNSRMLITLFMLCAMPAFAQVRESDAVKAIIGESLGQPYKAQVLIGAVIRHRGSLQGVYGITNPVIATADTRSRAKARRAWLASKGLKCKARYFGSLTDEAYFRSIGLRKVQQIGGIVFYR